MVRRSKRIENRIDRLSGLPDCLLHHILSFLDTKSSIQTSILSRRWISVWKHVPVLTFTHSPFKSDSGFERYVDQVLSLRSDCSSVTRVTVDVSRRMDLLDRIIRYVASHGVEELFICALFLKAFGSVSSCYQFLKVLELEGVSIHKSDAELFSGFQLLESLTLTYCNLTFSADASQNDAFANFFRLKTLKLVRCYSFIRISGNHVLIVTGPKLLSLEIVWPRFESLQINAPKLQSLSLKIDISCCTLIKVSKSNLPSLSRANIGLFMLVDTCASDNGVEKQLLLELCANLFKVLHNVQVLTLQAITFEFLIEGFSLMKHQSPPFTRMKSLNLHCLEGGSLDVPDEIIHYFLGGSPNGKDKCFTIERLH